MKLNIPKLDGKKFLIAGAGSGFDVFAGLPLAYELGLENVVFSNYGVKKQFGNVDPLRVSLDSYSGGTSQGCVIAGPESYPEGFLDVPGDVYSIVRQGVQCTLRGFNGIIQEHDIDTIILVDGGIDSLMKGDEEDAGTILEDFINLSAGNQVNVENKYLVCLGFGTENEEGLNHYRALENISELSASGHFLGSCSLTKEMDAFKFYKERCGKAWGDDRRVSHIHSRVLPSIEGEFGDGKDNELLQRVDARLHGEPKGKTFLSPLSGMMWFFDLPGVVESKGKIMEGLKTTLSFTDAMSVLRNHMMSLKDVRGKRYIPL